MEITTKAIDIRPDGRMNTPNAAVYLGVSCSTLNHWRTGGTGPKYVKLGRKIFYHEEELKIWASQNREVSS